MWVSAMAVSALSLAKESILGPANLLEHDIDQIMGCLLAAQVDAADIYFQSSRYESWVLEDGIIKQGTHNRPITASKAPVFGLFPVRKQVLPTATN